MTSLKKLIDCGLKDQQKEVAADFGLLFLRVGLGLIMAFSHGLGKVQSFWGSGPIQFADPIGIGPKASLFLAGHAEFVLALFVAAGFLTRLSAIPVAFTMAVAAFIVHANDPFAKMEFGLLFLIGFLAIALIGPGRFSLDHILNKKSS